MGEEGLFTNSDSDVKKLQRKKWTIITIKLDKNYGIEYRTY